MKMNRFALLLAAVLVPASALAQSRSISPEIKKLRDEIAAIKLDRALGLTRDQARELLPLLKETAQLRDQLRAQQEQRKPEIVQALTAVRDDLVKTGVVSPASRKALELARGEGTMNDIRAKMRAVLEKTRGVLNPEQKARLRGYDHRPLEFGDHELEGGYGEGEKPAVRGPQGRAGPRLKKILRVAASPEFIALVEVKAK